MNFAILLNVTVRGCRTNQQVRRALEMSGIEYEDRSWVTESGREILDLWVEDYRIYMPPGYHTFVTNKYMSNTKTLLPVSEMVL